MFWLALVLVLIIIDQLAKWIAVHSGWPIFLNNQFAFSIPLPMPLMYAIYILVLTGMSVYVYRTWSRFTNMQRWAWALVYAGGLSNIGERLVLGHVRDFIPVAGGMLNAADFFIFLGLLLLIVSNRYSKERES